MTREKVVLVVPASVYRVGKPHSWSIARDGQRSKAFEWIEPVSSEVHSFGESFLRRWYCRED